MKPVPCIILVGFMAAGKTTVGKRLAALLGVGFVDLDDEIVARHRCGVGEIFRRHGEAAFRTAEREALASALAGPATVIAVGGGAWCDPRNRDAARAAGAVAVFLDLPWSELWRRLSVAAGDRPLLATRGETRALFDARVADYRRADLIVPVPRGASPDEAAALVHAAVMEVACGT